MVRIAEVIPGSIADELNLEIGSRVLRINGAHVRDGIDYRYLEVDPLLEVELTTVGGERFIFEIEKDAGEPLGIVTAPDAVRECCNKCVFCFIDGNPEGARPAVWLKDDDFRLSFTYGTYVTLTNLGPKGFERLLEQRLSPLYVSVHATEPEVRMRLLGVPRGGDIVEQLQTLTAGGIEVHTQVVLCPGWNDGVHLDRTMDDLWTIGERVLSLSVVPVGLTRYNLGRPVRLLEKHEALAAIRQVDRARERARAERGTGWIYAADELFFIAGQALPPATYYDDWPLTENGVGSVRSFLDAFDSGVDSLPSLTGQRIAIVTGTRMDSIIAPLVKRLNAVTGARAEVVSVQNQYFGPTVTTAGLLPGRDIIAALQARTDWDRILLPAESLNADRRFVDDVSLESVAAANAHVPIVPAHELTAALCQP